MASIIKNNRASRTLVFTRVLAGIAAHFTAAILLGGKNLAPQAIALVFQTALQSLVDLDAARKEVAVKLQAKVAAVSAADEILQLLKKYLEVTYGADSPVLQDFGLTAPRTPVVTTEVKAASQSKAKATRSRKKAALQSASAEPAPVTTTPAK